MCAFVKRAQVADGVIPIQVGDLTEHVFQFWLQDIQPVIRKSPNRLDWKWDWSWLYRWLPSYENQLGRYLARFAVEVHNDHGDPVPTGLVLLSRGYPALDDHREQSVYLWYLTGAPIQALQNLKVSTRRRLLEILVDIALVVSEAQGYGGRIGLHSADEAGNPEAQKLLLNYQTRCHLLSLPKDVKMPSLVRNLVVPNDGRYFYTTPQVAEERMAALDCLR